jgi:hypothetical protein
VWQVTVTCHEDSEAFDVIATVEQWPGLIDPIVDLGGLDRKHPAVAMSLGLIDVLCREQLKLFDVADAEL